MPGKPVLPGGAAPGTRSSVAGRNGEPGDDGPGGIGAICCGANGAGCGGAIAGAAAAAIGGGATGAIGDAPKPTGGGPMSPAWP